MKVAQGKINDYHQHISFFSVTEYFPTRVDWQGKLNSCSVWLQSNNRRHLLKDFWNMIGSYFLWHDSSWFYNEIFCSQKMGWTAALTVIAHCPVWVLKLIPMKIYNHKTKLKIYNRSVLHRFMCYVSFTSLSIQAINFDFIAIQYYSIFFPKE